MLSIRAFGRRADVIKVAKISYYILKFYMNDAAMATIRSYHLQVLVTLIVYKRLRKYKFIQLHLHLHYNMFDVYHILAPVIFMSLVRKSETSQTYISFYLI